MRYLWLLLLCGCAAQMTEAEREYAQYQEQERVIAYRAWENECHRRGGVVYILNPVRRCHRNQECIPDKSDWSQYKRNNHVQCVRYK